MTALVLVPVMAIIMNVLVAMDRDFMAVLMAVVGMGACLMHMLVLMFVFAVATHLGSPPCHLIFDKF
jgi:hypothetical protein